jgi:hypothetical protein
MRSALFWFYLVAGTFMVMVALFGLWMRRRQLARGRRSPVSIWLSVQFIAMGFLMWFLAFGMASGPTTAEIWTPLIAMAFVVGIGAFVMYARQILNDMQNGG